jgi:hypothetical protein
MNLDAKVIREKPAMGNFYVSFTVKTDDAGAAVETLRRAGRSAFVTPELTGYVLVTDELADQQDPMAIQQVGELLSGELEKPVLAVLNHDDDILCYWLFEGGRTTDQYDSDPGYFEGEDEPPSGGDAERLCSAFGAEQSIEEVRSILADREGYLFAVDRHEALTGALGLPETAVGFGYGYVEAGDILEGIEPGSLIRTP